MEPHFSKTVATNVPPEDLISPDQLLHERKWKMFACKLKGQFAHCVKYLDVEAFAHWKLIPRTTAMHI